jgi:hypothetical protein
MISQFTGVATHCTQFSREQRFDTIAEVRSVLTKGFSMLKIVLLILILAGVGVAAYLYVPKIIEKAKAEKAERLVVDFNHEMEKINAETKSLCEKYKLVSIDEQVDMPAWKEDSVRISQQLAPFLSQETLREKAKNVIGNQKKAIIESRQHDFDALLMTEFRQATDSIAVRMKADAPESTDSLMFAMAHLWYQKTH